MATDLSLLNEYWQSALDSPTWIDFKKNATNDFEFVEGNQLTAEEVTELTDRGQPQVIENELHPIVEDSMGVYKSQASRIVYRGRNIGEDETSANTLTDMSLHAEQESDYEFEEGDMARDAFTCGMGVMEVYATIDDFLQPKVGHRQEDVLNMFPDPNSKRYDWNIDAKFVARAKWMHISEAKVKWPSKLDQINAYVNQDPVDDGTSSFKRENFYDKKSKKIRPVEMWYKGYEKVKVAVLDDVTVDVSKFNKTQMKKFMSENKEAQILERVDTSMKYSIFIDDTIELEGGDSIYDHDFYPFVPFFIYRKKSGEPYSAIRLLKDPQKEINKRRSKSLHLLNTNQVIMDDNAVRDEDELRDEVAKPDGIIKKKKGSEFSIEKNIDVSQGQMVLLQESKESIRRISGTTNNAGDLPREVRSGVGLRRAQSISDIRKLPQFNNLRRTRKMIGSLRYELMKQFYTQEKTFFITDNMGAAKSFELTKGDIKTIKESNYDIIIEEAPDVATIQEEQATEIGNFMSTFGRNLPVSIALQLLMLRFKMSNIRGKNEMIEQFTEQMKNAQPELPKTQLQLQWAELQPEEKIAFAQMMNLPQLAQAQAMNPNQPISTKKEIGETHRAMIKAQTELIKEKDGKGSSDKA